MAIINLCPHSFDVYNESQFTNLEQTNATTWIADGVEGEPIVSIASSGSMRIATTTVPSRTIEGIPTVVTQYGEAVLIPNNVTNEDRVNLFIIDLLLSTNNVTNEDTLVVSLPTQSMAKAANHPLAPQMGSPYRVVRVRSNTSTVLGCMGLSFQ